jgi:hypothetical protein
MKNIRITIPKSLSGELLMRQVDAAINYIARKTNIPVKKVKALIKQVVFYVEPTSDEHLSIYALITFKDGDSCILPLLYTNGDSILLADDLFFEGDSTCEF